METPHLIWDRRDFLRLALAASAGVAAGVAQPRPKFRRNPFTLGVSSGDPSPDGFVLWTRLAPDALNGGGLGSEDVAVRWQVFADENAAKTVREGRTVASAGLAHSVHVEVAGLRPDTWYWYRFSAGEDDSPLGRTRTAPLAASARPFRFAFVSCQNYEHGYFTAFDHLSRENIELVIHLGDYIYEKGAGKGANPRHHPPDTAQTLDQYRLRYAVYQLDSMLQAAHARFPWIVTPDDHEVSNNYANDIDELETPPAVFLKRREAAYQAYYEHMPLRLASLPKGPSMRLYRRVPYGSLASFHVLDGRQFRSDQPCGDNIKPVCRQALDPHQTMLGQAQEEWLQTSLDRSTARWNVLAQQVLMAEVNWSAAPGELLEHMDKWDGYHAARLRLYDFLAARKPANPVVITGDIHSNWVNDLKRDSFAERSPILATEFAGTSISSGGDRPNKHGDPHGWLVRNPQVRYFDDKRGYVLCDIRPEAFRTDFRVLDYVTRTGSPVRTAATYIVEDGRPGAQKV
jgi:alkaline phosphatase D